MSRTVISKWLVAAGVGLAVFAFAPQSELRGRRYAGSRAQAEAGPEAKPKPKPKPKQKDGSLDQDQIYSLGYWQAKGGEHAAALATLRTAQNQADPRVQTMIGFTLRKLGRVDEAMGYYQSVLAAHPDAHHHAPVSGRGLPADGRPGQGQGAAGRDRQALRRRLRGLPVARRRDRQVRTSGAAESARLLHV